jgi:hypothetical protein
MAWTLHLIPSAKKAEAEAVLRDDVISRQSHTVRDAASVGGPAAHLYVMVEGAEGAVQRADEMLKPLSAPLAVADRDAIHQKFKDEQESASTGMGLFFTE